MYFRILLCLLFASIAAHPQDRSTYRWYFHIGLGINFNTAPPSILSGGQTVNTGHGEGTSVACDSATGNLLFYSDGNTIWNRNHAVMASNIHPQSVSSTQAVLIIRQPGSQTLYHLFTTAGLGRTPGARHIVVDMALNGGLGDVVSNTQIILNTVCEKLTAVRACNGIDYWVIFRRYDVAEFHAFGLTQSGFNTTPVVSNSGKSFSVTALSRGEMKFSPNGRLLGCVNENDDVELYDFNNATGTITNRRVLGTGQFRYGLTFSPNSRWLYVDDGWSVGNNIFRYDVTAPNIAATMQTLFTTSGGCCFMELAPDGNIYIARNGRNFISTISNPDAVTPTFTDQAITFSANMQWGLPNFPQDLFIPDFAGPDVLACPNQPVQIGIAPVAGYTYLWTPANALNNATLPQPLATVTQKTTFTVTATDANGCSIIRDMVVDVRPRPTITAAASKQTICPGESTTLSATLPGATSFTWRPGNINGSSAIVTPLGTTTYRVTIVDANGCTWQDSTTITVRNRPNVSVQTSPPIINGFATICAGQSVLMSAIPGLSSYQWSSGETTSSISVTTAGRYIVQGTDANGCINWDTVNVAVNPLPNANAGNDTSVCALTTLQLRATGGTSYLWTALNSAPQLNRNGSASPTLNTPQSGTFTYVVDVTDANGCSKKDSIAITVHALPSAVISPVFSDTTICSCSMLTLSAPSAQSYQWYRNVPNNIISTNQTVTVSDSGTYYVRVTDNNGCSNLSFGSTVHLRIPQAQFIIQIPDSAVVGETVTININNTGTDLTACGVDSAIVHLTMNRHPLAPFNSSPGGTVTGDIRKLSLPIKVTSSGTTASLTYITTLGATDVTPIIIDSIEWKNCAAMYTVTQDTFRVAGICYARGVKRLYNEGAVVTMLVQPNPVGTTSTVQIESNAVVEQCTVKIVDVLGRTLDVLYKGDILQGVNQVTLQPNQLPDGIYAIVLQTPTNETLTTIIEVRK
ncbi:MAG: hypothetical protein K1X91_06860 [Bacteriodetes bacterium]|nr:hypothetical protein [Bacteroidota bacterium]